MPKMPDNSGGPERHHRERDWWDLGYDVKGVTELSCRLCAALIPRGKNFEGVEYWQVHDAWHDILGQPQVPKGDV